LRRRPARYSPAAALLIGAALDRCLGDPQRLHPVGGFGAVAAFGERSLWRDSRRWGVGYSALFAGAPAAAVALAERRLRGRPYARTAFAAFVLWSTLGGRSLGCHAQALGAAVAREDLELARSLAPALVGRDLAGLDGPELCRAAVESVAENTTDAVVAPLCWFAVIGPAGAALYRAANTLDAMVGYRSRRYASFGWASARLDDTLTWPSARLATALAVVISPTVGGRSQESARALTAAREHPSPNAGLIEAAFAGALRVRLGGGNCYGGRFEQRPTFGSGALPGPVDINRAVRLSQAVALTTLATLILARIEFT
jgi:adenosylcobinamide-phosphate synthase